MNPASSTHRPSLRSPSPLAWLLMPWMASLLLSLAAALPSQAVAQEGQRLPTTQLSAGIHIIQAEVATTPEQRELGLMYRRAMAPNVGMLFVFEQPATQCFWMKNTPLPLSAAFVADDGSVVNIEDMAPRTENSHCSTRPVRYVLEMNQGWFAKRGIKPGFVLSGDAFKPK